MIAANERIKKRGFPQINMDLRYEKRVQIENFIVFSFEYSIFKNKPIIQYKFSPKTGCETAVCMLFVLYNPYC